MVDFQDGSQDVVELPAARLNGKVRLDMPAKRLGGVEASGLVRKCDILEDDVVERCTLQHGKDARELEVPCYDRLVVDRLPRLRRCDTSWEGTRPAVELSLQVLDTEQLDLALERKPGWRRLRRIEDRVSERGSWTRCANSGPDARLARRLLLGQQSRSLASTGVWTDRR